MLWFHFWIINSYFKHNQMNYDIKVAIESLLSIQYAIETKVQALQLAANDYDVGVAFVAEGRLNVTQVNELIQQIDNYGHYTAIASIKLTDKQLLIAQSIHDYFINDDGFYSDTYLSNLFKYPNSEVIINKAENKVVFDSTSTTVEITMDEFITKLVDDYKENKEKFVQAFNEHYSLTQNNLKLISRQLTTNKIEFNQIVVINEYADITQANESIIHLSNQIEGIYKNLNPEFKRKFEQNTNDDDSWSVNKIIYVVIVILGICLISSLLIMLFTKPAIDAGINSVVKKK